MKLTDQVCTLEQAKKLQELGVNQPSNFKWLRGEIELEEQEGENAGAILGIERGFGLFFAPDKAHNIDKFVKVSEFNNEDVEFHWSESGGDRIEIIAPDYPAYTVAELGELFLQDEASLKRIGVNWTVITPNGKETLGIAWHTPAGALANYGIYLLENAIISTQKTTEA